MNPFKEVETRELCVKWSLLGVVYASLCLFGERELINPFANMITPLPSHVGQELTHTKTPRDVHTDQARPHTPLNALASQTPTETDSTKISLQGFHVNTTRCNINSIRP